MAANSAQSNGATRAESERQRLLEALQARPVTATQAREVLDINKPACRIAELRKAGHLIRHTYANEARHGRLCRVDQWDLIAPGISTTEHREG